MDAVNAGVDARIADIVLDCEDPERLALFWSALLGLEVGGRRGPYVWLGVGEGGLGLVFQRAEAPTPGKNRMHVDLRVSDVAAAKARVEELGGRRLDGYEDGGFLVMADPEGNEFCVIPEGPIGMDEEGRAHYL